MRVALDARTVFAPRRRGTGKNLIDLYATLATRRPGWEFILFHQATGHDRPLAHLPNVTPAAIDIAGDRFSFWQHIRLPIAAWQQRADVLHCPANTAPLATVTPTVLTIHDLIPLEIAPDAVETRRWLGRVRHGARRARRIITPSQYSRDAIVTHLGVSDTKVTVNYWAPDQSCQPPDADAVRAVRQTYGIPEQMPYLLAFGAEDPRKNTVRVIQAWGRVARPQDTDACLLVIGLQPAALAAMQALAATVGCTSSCHLRGFVPESDIVALVGGAAALCYPSLSEGFGLPVVDAFACGTAVITSTTTSLPEVAGDAALLVDPTDVDAIADAMTSILQSAPLRARLVRAGRERLDLFSWNRCADTVAGVLEQAADGGAR